MESDLSLHSDENIEDQAQDLTDVESVAATLLSLDNSSITQYPASLVETEVDINANAPEDVDEVIRVLLNSQFPEEGQGNKKTKQEVFEWLNTTLTSGDDTPLGLEPRIDFHVFSTEEKEKIAGHLLDGIKNCSFDPAKCIDTDQEVPGNFKTNFMIEVKIHPGLTLMNCIKALCAEDNPKNLYLDILRYACLDKQPSPGCSSKASEILCEPKRELVNFKTLLNYSGGYFSEMRLKLKGCSSKVCKKKQFLVTAVEQHVTAEIAQAAKAESAILFTQYGSIVDVINKCNKDEYLNFDPFKLAGYGCVLQRAVHQELVARCLDFLKHVGYELMLEDVTDEDRHNLSSNESTWSLSQGMCSQNSQAESCSSQSQSQPNETAEQIDELQLPALNNVGLNVSFGGMSSPGGSVEEYGRGDSQGSGMSSFDSQRSLSLYSSQTPPQNQYSIPELPEQEPSPLMFEADDNGDIGLINPEDLVVDYGIFEDSDVSDGSQSSYGSGEPRRRRRRLE